MCSHRKGRPVLIGTVDVAESEAFAQRLLAEGIPCRILNARNDTEEAAIIAEAGMPGAVTVSTNMAGRGVDIRLGGPKSTHGRIEGGAPEPSIGSLLPDLYEICFAVSGQEAVTKLERRLWLTLLDKCRADYLEEVGSLREGVHLAAFGNLNPLDVFHKEIIFLYEDMWRRHGREVADWFSMMTADGEFLENIDGPSRPSATWTYLVLDTPDQFSRLPQLVKATTAAVSAPMLALLAWYDRRKSRRRAQLDDKVNIMRTGVLDKKDE